MPTIWSTCHQSAANSEYLQNLQLTLWPCTLGLRRGLPKSTWIGTSQLFSLPARMVNPMEAMSSSLLRFFHSFPPFVATLLPSMFLHVNNSSNILSVINSFHASIGETVLNPGAGPDQLLSKLWLGVLAWVPSKSPCSSFCWTQYPFPLQRTPPCLTDLVRQGQVGSQMA